jgi:hypothetical protein
VVGAGAAGAGAAGAGAAGEGAQAGAGAFAQEMCRAAVGRCTQRGRTADGPRAKPDFSAKTDIKRAEEFGYAGIQRQDGQLWCTVYHEPSNHRHKVIRHINILKSINNGGSETTSTTDEQQIF